MADDWNCTKVACIGAIEQTWWTRYNEPLVISEVEILRRFAPQSARALLIWLCAITVLVLACAAAPLEAAAAKKHLLVVSMTKGFHHSSIPLGEQIIKDLGDKTGQWDVDYVLSLIHI